MKRTNILLTTLTALLPLAVGAQQPAAHFDMSLTTGSISELTSGTRHAVASALPATSAAAPDGEALRFDGYSTYVRAAVPTTGWSTDALTLSVVLAAESYPMMQADVAETTPTYTAICGNLDEGAKQGVALELSSQGDLRLRYGSATGFLMTVQGTQKLPRGQWCTVTAVMDKGANAATLYLDGVQIGTGRMSRAAIAHSSADFIIGKSADDKRWGPFLLNTFCGLIDDISISNEVVTKAPTAPKAPPSAPEGATIDHTSAYSSATKTIEAPSGAVGGALPSGAVGGATPDFSYPLSRYTDAAPSGASPSLWRPLFHGMPSGSWTNETHGLVYSDGRWHVFFQKNANGPYMSRLHWGHISSADLCEWREEPIAIAPGESYDIKGCWSGCVYEHDGTHYILYTAVDNARATIAQARATDATLTKWEKQGIVIDGTPAGGFQDFRDPYYFEAGGQQYVIVGTGRNGVGCCTLHKRENGAWTNDGTVFFQGTTAQLHGTFWEMPNVTPMGDGRWLFTCTPLGTGVGVRTLCWVGTIGTDGRFTPTGDMQYLELGGISRDGYGLLSPSIAALQAPPSAPEGATIDHTPAYSSATKTIEAPSGAVGGALLLGIVPDKLPTQCNYDMGWAHNYSLPRELTLDADGQLVQRPYSGLTAMRTATSVNRELQLEGTESLSPVSGRQMELLGEFTVTTGTCGFNLLTDGTGRGARLSYDAARGTLKLDLTQLERTVNDGAPYNGVYTATLPRKVAAGETLKLHVFLDGSIADIFVCDRWAFSVRLFPTNAAATGAEVFATAATPVKVSAWTLNPTQHNPLGISTLGYRQPVAGTCFDLQGRPVGNRPCRGLYIKDGRKYVAR